MSVHPEHKKKPLRGGASKVHTTQEELRDGMRLDESMNRVSFSRPEAQDNLKIDLFCALHNREFPYC